MKPSPCLHPVCVYDNVTGDFHYVPCGHCEACICGKGFRLADRLGEAIARYTYKYFVTLTFSDDWLPVASYDDDTSSFVHPYDCDYNGVLYSVPYDVVLEDVRTNEDFRITVNKYHGIPVLSRRLIINFKKRLRKLFTKLYGKEKLFIYCVGEYGPSTFRPHYHIVLCTNAPVQASEFELCVHKAWSYYDKVRQEYICQYGIIDFQRIISKGLRSYVAQYINCHTNLPRCLSSGDFRPFYQSTPLIDTDSLRFKDSDLRNLYYSPTPVKDSLSFVDNSTLRLKIPKGLVDRVFPKCYKFGSLSFCDRVSFYSVFLQQPFSHVDDFVSSILNGFLDNSSSFSICRQLLVDDDLFASEQRLIRHFYLSRRVCNNARTLGVSLVDYVKRIDLFWSNYELYKLKEFYELQESLLTDKFNPCELSDLFCMYYNTSDIKHLDYYIYQFNCPNPSDSIDLIPLQMEYSNLMHKILLDTSKTKKRNDYFDKKGYVRSSFISKLKVKKSWQVFSRI